MTTASRAETATAYALGVSTLITLGVFFVVPLVFMVIVSFYKPDPMASW